VDCIASRDPVTVVEIAELRDGGKFMILRISSEMLRDIAETNPAAAAFLLTLSATHQHAGMTNLRFGRSYFSYLAGGNYEEGKTKGMITGLPDDEAIIAEYQLLTRPEGDEIIRIKAIHAIHDPSSPSMDSGWSENETYSPVYIDLGRSAGRAKVGSENDSRYAEVRNVLTWRIAPSLDE
jgi:hypothetical protein